MSEKPWDINEKLKARTGADLLKLLTEELSGTELNSLLLAAFDRIAAGTAPASLLKAYDSNRFVHPAEGDMLSLRSKELQTLQTLQANSFQPIELSPVSLLGSCSAVGTVDQKKICSATRGTEVLADATNALAIHIAWLKKRVSEAASIEVRLCTTHRHLRTAPLKVKGHTAHFTIACWVTSGRDTGSFQFEMTAFLEHLRALQSVLTKVFGVKISHIKLQPRTGYEQGERLVQYLRNQIAAILPVSIDENAPPNDYYKGIQYKAIIEMNGQEIEIADGGFTDWTQQLLSNKKERFLITGLGIEFLNKIT